LVSGSYRFGQGDEAVHKSPKLRECERVISNGPLLKNQVVSVLSPALAGLLLG
jgi:hypothetical protein